MSKQKTTKNLLPMSDEKVRIETTFRGKYRGFAYFLICCALLIAAFAISSVWVQSEENGWLGNSTGEEHPGTDDQTQAPTHTESSTNDGNGSVLEFPDSATPIVRGDLSYLSLGEDYIHNETAYSPNLRELMQRELDLLKEEAPAVLILHTHTSEGYLPAGTAYITEPLGTLTYTRDADANVLAVGRALAAALQKKGITAIHCTVMHDASGLGGAYERSAETVKRYLEEYPEICLVIDLHRDAVVRANGEAVNAAVEIGGESVAQVMAVVGTDGNGTAHDGWEDNLALALQLRNRLNQGGNLCRPVSLRNASFYQELSPYALLLEIGTAAGSVEEAVSAAELVGEAIASLLY